MQQKSITCKTIADVCHLWHTLKSQSFKQLQWEKSYFVIAVAVVEDSKRGECGRIHDNHIKEIGADVFGAKRLRKLDQDTSTMNLNYILEHCIS